MYLISGRKHSVASVFPAQNISWRAVGFMQKNSSRTVITTTGTAGIKYAFISFPYVFKQLLAKAQGISWGIAGPS